MTTTPTETDECEFLCDYCATCVEQCGCGRWDTRTEPDEIECRVEGSTLRMEAVYVCAFGHRWTTRFTEPCTHP